MEYEDEDTLLRNARKLAEAGNREEALKLVRRVVVSYPDQVDGWWVLANVTHETSEQRYALEQALAIQPDHPGALRMLEDIKKRRSPLWYGVAALTLVMIVMILILLLR